MANYQVKLEVEYPNGMLVEETYEVFAYDIDDAEARVLKGEGDLTDEEIIEYPDAINEKVVSIQRMF